MLIRLHVSSSTNQWMLSKLVNVYKMHCHPAVTHTHTTVLLLFWNFSGTTRVSRYQKGKTRKVKANLDLLEQEIVSGSGICWAICKSAPHPRLLNASVPHSLSAEPSVSNNAWTLTATKLSLFTGNTRHLNNKTFTCNSIKHT